MHSRSPVVLHAGLCLLSYSSLGARPFPPPYLVCARLPPAHLRQHLKRVGGGALCFASTVQRPGWRTGFATSTPVSRSNPVTIMPVRCQPWCTVGFRVHYVGSPLQTKTPHCLDPPRSRLAWTRCSTSMSTRRPRCWRRAWCAARCWAARATPRSGGCASTRATSASRSRRAPAAALCALALSWWAAALCSSSLLPSVARLAGRSQWLREPAVAQTRPPQRFSACVPGLGCASGHAWHAGGERRLAHRRREGEGRPGEPARALRTALRARRW